MVIPRFVDQALRGRPITVYGDGSQVRSFTWVGDTVEAMIRLMASQKAEGGVFNVGSDEAVTIGDLAERVRRMIDPRLKIIHVPYEQAFGAGFEDIRYRVPDITRLRETVGYAPTVELTEILERVVDFSREKLGERLAVAAS